MIEVVCLQCLTLATPVCKCTNVASLYDVDGHINIYVEDIRTCRLAHVQRDNDHQEVYRELLQAFDTQIYVPYKDVRTSHLNFQPFVPKNTYVRKSPEPDWVLMAALDRYEHSTATPLRMGSTYQQPSIKDHS